MARVLLTGARGFIGRHCLRRLATEGWEVHAVASRTGPGEESITVREGEIVWHTTDLLHTEAMRRVVERAQPTHLLHLAWYTVPGDLYHSPENERWLAAGRELLAATARHGVQRAVVAGSCAEYDWSAGVCHETETPLEPATVYGAAKNALRREFEPWAAAEGRSGAWARLFFLYGPGEHPDRLVPYVIRSLLSGHPAECTHGEQRRDYLYVEDAAEALVRLLGSEVTGPINLASGRALRLRELILETARQLGRPDQVRLGARPAPPDEAPLVQADVTRQVEELGWQPTTDLEAGLAATIDWWRRELAQAAGAESP